jgi:hypothetical protein
MPACISVTNDSWPTWPAGMAELPGPARAADLTDLADA